MTLDMEQVPSLDIENSNLKSSPYQIFARMMVPALSQATLQLARAQTVSDRAAIVRLGAGVQQMIVRLGAGVEQKTRGQRITGGDLDEEEEK